MKKKLMGSKDCLEYLIRKMENKRKRGGQE